MFDCGEQQLSPVFASQILTSFPDSMYPPVAILLLCRANISHSGAQSWLDLVVQYCFTPISIFHTLTIPSSDPLRHTVSGSFRDDFPPFDIPSSMPEQPVRIWQRSAGEWPISTRGTGSLSDRSADAVNHREHCS